jgi:hypothetical protein
LGIDYKLFKMAPTAAVATSLTTVIRKPAQPVIFTHICYDNDAIVQDWGSSLKGEPCGSYINAQTHNDRSKPLCPLDLMDFDLKSDMPSRTKENQWYVADSA